MKLSIGLILILLIIIVFIKSYSSLAPTSSPTPTLVSSILISAEEIIIDEITRAGLTCADACTVEKIEGDYGKGLMPMGYWIAKKVEGSWKAVVTGNGIPPCSEIDSYSIPQSIYGNCIEQSGDLRH